MNARVNVAAGWDLFPGFRIDLVAAAALAGLLLPASATARDDRPEVRPFKSGHPAFSRPSPSQDWSHDRGQRRAVHTAAAHSHRHVRARVVLLPPGALTDAPRIIYRTASLAPVAVSAPSASAVTYLPATQPIEPPAAAEVDRAALFWRPVAPAPAIPSFASSIRFLESPAVALDGATFTSNDVIYKVRGFDAPPRGTPQGAAALQRLAALLGSGERMIVYPVGLDRDDRMVADVMLGGADLAERLRAR